jgi:hypothetical protein
MAGEQYPKRPQYFSNKFCRLMTKTALANEIGADAVVLLMVIAHTEDAKGYRGAVTYFNGQLMPLIGKNTDHALIRVREKAIESGWLHYEPGAKGIPGKYWVTIPSHAEGLRDKATDENPDEYREVNHICHDEIDSESGAEAERKRSTSGVQAECKRSESVNHSTYTKKPRPREEAATDGTDSKPEKTKPSPEAVPLPPTLNLPAFAEIWREWIDYRREIKKPLTDRNAKAQLADLAKLAPSRAVDCIRSSIANGYQGLFPEKFAGPPGRPPPQAQISRPRAYDVPSQPLPPIPAELLQ